MNEWVCDLVTEWIWSYFRCIINSLIIWIGRCFPFILLFTWNFHFGKLIYFGAWEEGWSGTPDLSPGSIPAYVSWKTNLRKEIICLIFFFSVRCSRVRFNIDIFLEYLFSHKLPCQLEEQWMSKYTPLALLQISVLSQKNKCTCYLPKRIRPDLYRNKFSLYSIMSNSFTTLV